MLGKLLQLYLRHVHERVNLAFGALKVLDAERVDSDHLDTGFVADFEDLSVAVKTMCNKSHASWSYSGKCLEPQAVSFYSLNMVISREPPISVHHKSYMLRDGTLPKGTDE